MEAHDSYSKAEHTLFPSPSGQGLPIPRPLGVAHTELSLCGRKVRSFRMPVSECIQVERCTHGHLAGDEPTVYLRSRGW